MRSVSRCLLGFVTCVVSVFIAACYGMAYTFSQRGRVIDSDTKTGIAGLRVQCLNEIKVVTDMTHTATDGAFALHAESSSACGTIAVDDDRETGPRYAPTRVDSKPSTELVIEVTALP